MTNEEYARRVLPHVKTEYFFTEPEKNLYKIYEEYFKKYNKVPSKQGLLVEIENRKASADDYTELKKLVSGQETFSEDLSFLLTTTEQFCKDRALYNAIKESVLIADSKDKKGKQTPDAIPTILSKALSISFDTAIGHDYSEDAEARYDYYHKKESRLTTGIQILDFAMKGGPTRKTLNCFIAPPHGGKSMAMVNVGVGALNAGLNVLYITLEMAAEEIARRFDVNILNVDFDQLEMIPKATYINKFSSLKKKAMGTLKIKEYPTGTANAGHFKALLEEYKTKQNFIPDVIIIDYLNLCAPMSGKATDNSFERIKNVGTELRALMIEQNCVGWTATQTTRGGAGNSDFGIDSTSESFAIPALVDSFFAIIDSDELKKMNQIMFKQLKNRFKDMNELLRFVVGINRSKMKMYDVDNQDLTKKPGAKFVENNSPVINKSTDFDDFNF